MPSTAPEFGELVEYVTEGPVVHAVPLVQHSLEVLPTLEAVQRDYVKVAQIGRQPALTAGDLDALKVAAATVYHQDVVDNELVSTDPVTLVANLIAVRSRPEWHVGLDVVPPDGNGDGGVYLNLADMNLYRCIQAHTAQADWRPDLPGLDALWIRFYEPEAGPQPWVQPYGGSGTYVSGAEVTHNGFLWRNIIPPPTLNVWEPGVYGWEQLGPA